MLNPTQIAARDGKLTASRVACLMTGEEEKILNLWRELVGDPGFVPEDLSGVWPVQLGTCTEGLNLDWFERKHGAVSARGDVMPGPQDWMACTLDGWSVQHQCPIECKHTGGREPLETVIARYQPQMHWQMLCTEAKQCALSVILGGNEPVVEFIPFDEAYAAELMARAEAFWLCVQTLTPPVAAPAVTAPVKAEKTYDMAQDHQSNLWSVEAGVWLENRAAMKKALAAEKELKGLVPVDAARCFGFGVEIKRNRAGSLSLREFKE